MDFSKEYILMCEAAKEIQNTHEPKEGDFWCCSCTSCQENKKITIHNIADYEVDYVNQRDLTNVDTLYAKMVTFAENGFGGFWMTRNQGEDRGYTWLPRPDQLQEMRNKNVNKVIQLQGFSGIIDAYKYNSWEQLWLAFVMQEKFHKTWTEEGWVDC